MGSYHHYYIVGVAVLAVVWCTLCANAFQFPINIPGEYSGAFTNVTVDLGGTWNLTNNNGSIKTTGTVPGNVHMDLLAAKIIGDPYWGYNDVLQQWVFMDNWSYQKSFQLTTDVTSKKVIELQCDGLDTVAQITFNGQVIGNTNNQFVQYVFDISKLVKTGENTIQITFTSAWTWSNAQAAAYPYVVPVTQYPTGPTNRNFIRKEQCSFAWDWGPLFCTQGIWMPIRIVAISDAILEDITAQIFPVTIPPTSFIVKIDAYVSAAAPAAVTVSATVAGASGSKNAQLTAGDNQVTFNVTVNNPNLWWPNGYGNHPTYPLSVTLNVGTNTISQITKPVGFRSMEVVEDPRPGGLSFFFRVNGVPIFVKGSNWIPADTFENRVTNDVISDLLQSAADANMNLVRNWGGGIYQHDYFYTVADNLGLMVWQEFMFACSMYPRDQAFLDNVAAEVVYQIRRLSHHVSVVLWSGNNENESALGGWYEEVRTNGFLYAVDYAVLYLDTILPAVRSADPSRTFWPSSPSNGILTETPLVARWGNPSNVSYGDLHYYNYINDCTNVSILPRPRFTSEYGFQSSPSIFAWQQITDPSNMLFNGTFANHREHGSDGVPVQLLLQMQFHFTLPKNVNAPSQFENYIYLSQAMQALCIKTESEHYRRTKGDPENTMGAIYWQLNDIWQAQTWSSLEYGGRWKMLHYYVKNFFAPFLVSSYEDPVDHYGVYVTSDINSAVNGKLSINLWSYAGKQLATWNQTFSLAALGSVQIFSNSISNMTSKLCNRNECFLTLLAEQTSGVKLSTNVFYLTSLIQVKLPTPVFNFTKYTQVSANTIGFTVSATQVAPYTFLQTKLNGVFSDNGFLLLPNTPIMLQFVGKQSLSTTDLQNTLTATTVAFTY